jgi:hypothetical protein
MHLYLPHGAMAIRKAMLTPLGITSLRTKYLVNCMSEPDPVARHHNEIAAQAWPNDCEAALV